VKRYRGGLVFKAHRPLYHSTLSLRVIKKKNAPGTRVEDRDAQLVRCTLTPGVTGRRVRPPSSEDGTHQKVKGAQSGTSVFGLVFQAPRLLYHSIPGASAFWDLYRCALTPGMDSRSVRPPSSEDGTHKKVKTISWPWLSGKSPLTPPKLFPLRSEAVCQDVTKPR